jgi:amidase
MVDDKRPLWQWSACDLAEAIAARRVTAVEAVGSVVARMRATNGRINAVVDDLGEAALRQAEARDQELRGSGPMGPLHGVPVTIKENVDQKGRATPNGVVAFKGVIAPDDAPVVRNLERAGAIVIGRTNTPEFSFRGTTVNELHGRTYNPWNDTASAGGSSGGAAAAVMMGYGPIAHGNDIGGSLRFPAYACGAATVKPGLGRVPAFNPSATAERGLLAQVMSVQGVICREVRDVRLAMRALVHYDPRDPWQVPMPFDGPREPKPIKVAFTRNTFDFALHPAVARALETARTALAAAGYEVHEIEPPRLEEAAIAGVRCLFGEAKVLMDADVRRYGSKTVAAIFDEYYRYFQPYEGIDFLRAIADRNGFVRAWTTFMADYPLVLTPFLPAPIFTWNRDEQGADGVREVLGSALYSYSMNFMGLPAAVVPANENDGQPVGVQIVGRRFREDLILDAAEAVERAVGVMAERLWTRGT